MISINHLWAQLTWLMEVIIYEALALASYIQLVPTSNRIRIPYNCVELIFGMVHPSTSERLKRSWFLSILGSVTEEDPQGPNV